jgi:molybdopterin converting factor small subunit
VEREVTVALPPDSRVSDLLDELAVSLAPSAMLFLVNGRVAALDQPLSDGDEVHLIPAISGGKG